MEDRPHETGPQWGPEGTPRPGDPTGASAHPPAGPPPGLPWPQPGYAVGPYLPQQVAPKNPGLSLLVSFFIPGVGSMMNGDAGKGIAILVGYFISWMFFWLTIEFLVGVIFLPVLLGLWVWGMVDAYTGAQRWNARRGIIS